MYAATIRLLLLLLASSSTSYIHACIHAAYILLASSMHSYIKARTPTLVVHTVILLDPSIHIMHTKYAYSLASMHICILAYSVCILLLCIVE